MSGFDDRNRYSYSGADARAYAFYPAKFSGDSGYPGLREGLGELYKKRDRLRASMLAGVDTDPDLLTLDSMTSSPSSYIDDNTSDDSSLSRELLLVEGEITEKQKEIAKGLVFLESLATISYQVHEPKAPARALGYRAPKGFARSVRTIAGTMIFIVVEDHPLRGLMEVGHRFGPDSTSYSLDMDRGAGTHTNDNANISISTMIKPFNMLVQYSTEVPGSTSGDSAGLDRVVTVNAPGIASYMLENIEIISEGITTSVNDMVTEVVMQFQAHNVYQLSTENSVVDTIGLSQESFESSKEELYRQREIRRKELEKLAYEYTTRNLA